MAHQIFHNRGNFRGSFQILHQLRQRDSRLQVKWKIGRDDLLAAALDGKAKTDRVRRGLEETSAEVRRRLAVIPAASEKLRRQVAQITTSNAMLRETLRQASAPNEALRESLREALEQARAPGEAMREALRQASAPGAAMRDILEKMRMFGN